MPADRWRCFRFHVGPSGIAPACMGMGNDRCCASPLLRPQANSDHFDLTRLLTCRYTNKPISEARFGSARRARCYTQRTKQDGLEIAKVQPADNRSSDPTHCVLPRPVLYAGAFIDARKAGTDPGPAQRSAAQRCTIVASLSLLRHCLFAQVCGEGRLGPGLAWPSPRLGW
ncbi:hypothetical protein MRS44_014600 [Fusarium solani]|uniref:uncharacterized protein n=1 Tax=Fusarium solani TaxID=169388 RepID=UPI0032C3DE39|nr:hypothetical protein MRS44_014600 [Fusarium solani]